MSGSQLVQVSQQGPISPPIGLRQVCGMQVPDSGEGNHQYDSEKNFLIFLLIKFTLATYTQSILI